ncbi:MAG TPA: protein kinase [Candidatus Eisenbacteria bacterium]|nr:protein kinase [Candidatus Eisenbacteria bacterium]
MPLGPKTRLGTYEILGPLGAGGMGEVYRAKDLRLGREIAIKVLPEEVASRPDRLARFEHEARTVAGLNHPNIVTLHSVEDEGGTRFLTMELVEGETLSTKITPGGLPFARLLEIAIPLTDALVAAHERGVIHRDLKPGNVMVTREGRVKVLDFGLAKMMSADAAPQDATTAATADSGHGSVAGTAPYMAPEQLRGDAIDARSDLFSLGIIFYELATGRRPFAGGNFAEAASSILRDTPEPLSRMRADLPAEFAQIVEHCLEKRPRERVQTALDVNNALRRLRKLVERGAPERAESRKASIAVLPFVNRSASVDDEYFSDGLADELLNVLAKTKGLRVTARSSAFTFKGKQATAAQIGRALNVATLLEGSVRKAGNRIRVSVQLVSVTDSSHLWSETYDRTLEDIFSVQDDIAQSVVKELRATLLGEERDSDASGNAKDEVARAAKGRTTNPEAQRLYLLARYLHERHTREDLAKGIEYLKQALELDPKFALAWAELARAYGAQADQAWGPVAERYTRAREAVVRALTLEPDLPEAHAEMASILMTQTFAFRDAEASMARALELAPGNALVLRGAGWLAQTAGRLEEANELYGRALEQDPLSVSTWHNLGSALHAAGQLAESEGAYRKALELSPQTALTNSALSLVLLDQGREGEALSAAMRETDELFRLHASAIVHNKLGRRAESDVALQELIDQFAEGGAYQVAEVYAARGETNAAFEWLERAYAQHDGGLSEMKTKPCLRSLHGDPRWDTFLKKVRVEW